MVHSHYREFLVFFLLKSQKQTTGTYADTAEAKTLGITSTHSEFFRDSKVKQTKTRAKQIMLASLTVKLNLLHPVS